MKSVIIAFTIAWSGVIYYAFILGLKRLMLHKRLSELEKK